MGVVKAKAMKIDGAGFDADDFVAKLVTYMGDGAGIRARSESSRDDDENEEKDIDANGGMLDWKKIGILSTRRSRQAPVIDFMRVSFLMLDSQSQLMVYHRLGPLSAEMKQRKKTTRVRFEKTKEIERAPQQVRITLLCPCFKVRSSHPHYSSPKKTSSVLKTKPPKTSKWYAVKTVRFLI